MNMGVHSRFLMMKKNWKQIKGMSIGDWLCNFHIHSYIHNREYYTAITHYYCYLYVKISTVSEKMQVIKQHVYCEFIFMKIYGNTKSATMNIKRSTGINSG